MIEILCDNCGCHVCWMTDCGPRGSIYCDECYAEEAAEDDNNPFGDFMDSGGVVG